MWHVSKPPLHPKIRVDAKTPYNAIVVVDLDSEEGEGLIDLTSLEEAAAEAAAENREESRQSSSSTTRANSGGFNGSIGSADSSSRSEHSSARREEQTSAEAAAAAAAMAMASSGEEEDYDDELRDVPESSVSTGGSAVQSAVAEDLSDSVLTYSSKSHSHGNGSYQQQQNYRRNSLVAQQEPSQGNSQAPTATSTTNASATPSATTPSFGNMYRRALKNREERQQKASERDTTPLKSRQPDFHLDVESSIRNVNQDNHGNQLQQEPDRNESPVRYSSPSRQPMYEKAVKHMIRPATTERKTTPTRESRADVIPRGQEPQRQTATSFSSSNYQEDTDDHQQQDNGVYFQQQPQRMSSSEARNPQIFINGWEQDEARQDDLNINDYDDSSRDNTDNDDAGDALDVSTPRDIDSFIDLSTKTMWSSPWPVSSVRLRHDTSTTMSHVAGASLSAISSVETAIVDENGNRRTPVISIEDRPMTKLPVVSVEDESNSSRRSVAWSPVVTIQDQDGNDSQRSMTRAPDSEDQRYWRPVAQATVVNVQDKVARTPVVAGRDEEDWRAVVGIPVVNGEDERSLVSASGTSIVMDLPESWSRQHRTVYGFTGMESSGGERDRSDGNRHHQTTSEVASLGDASDMAHREPEQTRSSSPYVDPAKRSRRNIDTREENTEEYLHVKHYDDMTSAGQILATAQESFMSDDDPSRVTLWSRAWSASDKQRMQGEEDNDDGDVVVSARSVSPSWSAVPTAAISDDLSKILDLDSEGENPIYLGNSSLSVGKLPVVNEDANYDGARALRNETWSLLFDSRNIAQRVSGEKADDSTSERVVNESTTSQNPIVVVQSQTSQHPIIVDETQTSDTPVTQDTTDDDQSLPERGQYFVRSEHMLNEGILYDMRRTSSGTVGHSTTTQWTRSWTQANLPRSFVEASTAENANATNDTHSQGSKGRPGVDVDLTNIRGFSSSPERQRSADDQGGNEDKDDVVDLTNQYSPSPSPPRRRGTDNKTPGRKEQQFRQVLTNKSDKGQLRRVSPIRVDLTNVYSTSSGAFSDRQQSPSTSPTRGISSNISPLYVQDSVSHRSGKDDFAENHAPDVDYCSSGEESSPKKRRTGMFSQISISTSNATDNSQNDLEQSSSGVARKRVLKTGTWSQARPGGASKDRVMNSRVSPVRVGLARNPLFVSLSPNSTSTLKDEPSQSKEGNVAPKTESHETVSNSTEAASSASTVFEDDDTGVLDDAPAATKTEMREDKVSSLIDLSKRTLWSQPWGEPGHVRIKEKSEESDVVHLKVGGGDFQKAGAAMRDSLFMNMDKIQKDQKDMSRTDKLLSHLDDNSLLDDGSQWSESHSTAQHSPQNHAKNSSATASSTHQDNLVVPGSPSTSTLDPVIHAGASYESNPTKSEYPFQKPRKELAMDGQIIPEDSPAEEEIIHVTSSTLDKVAFTYESTDSRPSSVPSPRSDRLGSVLERARALLSSPKSGANKRDENDRRNPQQRSTASSTTSTFGFNVDDISGLTSTVAGTSRVSENEVTHLVDRSAVTKLHPPIKFSDNNVQLSHDREQSVDESHRFRRQGEMDHDGSLSPIVSDQAERNLHDTQTEMAADDSAFLKLRQRLVELEMKKKSGPDVSDNPESEAFAKISNHLLQLNLQDFKKAVMPNDHGQAKQVEKSIMALLNGADGVIPIAPILSNYSQDLALSDSSADSEDQSSRRTGSQLTSNLSVPNSDSQYTSFQASNSSVNYNDSQPSVATNQHNDSQQIPFHASSSSAQDPNSQRSSFHTPSLMHHDRSSQHSTFSSEPSPFQVSNSKIQGFNGQRLDSTASVSKATKRSTAPTQKTKAKTKKKSSTPTQKTKRRTDSKTEDAGLPPMTGKKTSTTHPTDKVIVAAKKYLQTGAGGKDLTPLSVALNGPNKKKVAFGIQPIALDNNSVASRVAYDEQSVSTRDTESKVSLQSYLETDESDLETNFESSTVPMLVRMIDRSCAWLEDHNTCGLDQPSLLSKSHVRKPPMRRSRRNDKMKVPFANKTASSRVALKRFLLEEQDAETAASSKATARPTRMEKSEAQTPKKSNLKKILEPKSSSEKTVPATPGNASYEKPIDVEGLDADALREKLKADEYQTKGAKTVPSTGSSKMSRSSSPNKSSKRDQSSEQHGSTTNEGRARGESVHQKEKGDPADTNNQGECKEGAEKHETKDDRQVLDSTSFKPKETRIVHTSSSDELDVVRPTLRHRRSASPLKLSVSSNHPSPPSPTSSSRTSKSPKKSAAPAPDQPQNRPPSSPIRSMSSRNGTSVRRSVSPQKSPPMAPPSAHRSLSPQKSPAMAPLYDQQKTRAGSPPKIPESPSSRRRKTTMGESSAQNARSGSKDPPSVSSNSSFQAKLKERMARIRGDEGSQCGSHSSPVRSRLEELISPPSSPRRGGNPRDPEEEIPLDMLSYNDGDESSPRRYYQIYDSPTGSPKHHRAAGGPEESAVPRADAGPHSPWNTSNLHYRKKEDPEGELSDNIVTIIDNDNNIINDDDPNKYGDNVNDNHAAAVDYMHLTEHERLAALELAEKLRRRAAALKRRKQLREQRAQEMGADDSDYEQ